MIHRHRHRVSSFAVLCVAAVLAVTACSSDGSGSTGTDGPPEGFDPIPEADWEVRTHESEVEIATRDNAYVPQNVVVSPGTKLRFDNIGRTPHDVVPAIKDQFESIPTADLQPGDVATLVLDEPGEYPYYCTLHGTATKGMVGRIRVEG